MGAHIPWAPRKTSNGFCYLRILFLLGLAQPIALVCLLQDAERFLLLALIGDQALAVEAILEPGSWRTGERKSIRIHGVVPRSDGMRLSMAIWWW